MKNVYTAIVPFFLSVSLLPLHGCTKAIYVPVERVVTQTITERDTTVLVRIERDTVRVSSDRDTVVRAETNVAEAEARYQKGMLSLRLNNKNVDLPAQTKVKIIKVTETVPEPYPVEKPMPYVPKFYTTVYIISLIIVFVWVVHVIIKAKKWIG